MCHLWTKTVLLLHFLFGYLLFLFLAWLFWLWVPVLCLIGDGRGGSLVFFLILRGEAFNILTLGMLAIGLSYLASYVEVHSFSYPFGWDILTWKNVEFIKYFFSIEIIIWLYLVLLMWCIRFNHIIEPSLYPRNEFHLIMVYDPHNLLFNLVC